MLLGMVELFAFVKVLEEDFDAVMRGVSIEYGSQTKGQTNVAQSMGWPKLKKRKRHTHANDGRAPDTTEKLALDNNHVKNRSKKIGRPRGSVNVDRNPFTTYPGYSASKDPQRRNQCWMAAAMESLYALYSTLWLKGTNGTGKDLFSALCHHFNSRITYELNEVGQILSVLSKGQSKLFNLARKKYEGSFIPGRFASCDFFIKILLDTNKNATCSLKGLFTIEEKRTFSCAEHPHEQHQHIKKSRPLSTILIKKALFDCNKTATSDVANLIRQWTTSGIHTNTGLHCCSCLPSNHQEKQPTGLVLKDPPTASDSAGLKSNSQLGFTGGVSPPHLYFFLEVTSIFGEAEQRSFMAVQDWPAKLNFAGEIYTLIARGYWTGTHYRCKVVRNVGGSVGVWLHDDQLNQGNTRLIGTNPAEIGGTSPDTSYLMYSRNWTAGENKYIQAQIKQITKDNPHVTGSVPFACIPRLLNGSEKAIPSSEILNTSSSPTDDAKSTATLAKVSVEEGTKTIQSPTSPNHDHLYSDSNSESDASLVVPPKKRGRYVSKPKATKQKPMKAPKKAKPSASKVKKKGPLAKPEALKAKSNAEIPWDRMLACQKADSEKNKKEEVENLKALAHRCPGFGEKYLGNVCYLSSSAPAQGGRPQKTEVRSRPSSSPILPSTLTNEASAGTGNTKGLKVSSVPPRRRSLRKSDPAAGSRL
ncbi:uncharacterized protein PGTG_22522 [Puccinia graminis f. sp. tritici CRL 75-36-700-3]|uniref:USP domain-containing protein n=1 Tax=Puccinia graminis f. sp. tritici (strain CRL 75-36-700-3 / race SCCL) TaxID=418459 RepID=H6QUT5_PUCGT|nr:uncharacterized protein PGTG_22522 [Puccinia graminis f. sp. tritici CRL 75-36-700-3]EHS64843.1 hypothetical protein PGTG_22522 [Puccinia graminis f. sp. tritici CRL 75-36-700-3]